MRQSQRKTTNTDNLLPKYLNSYSLKVKLIQFNNDKTQCHGCLCMCEYVVLACVTV